MPPFSLDRRQFTLGAAAVATAALIRPAEALAQAAAGPDDTSMEAKAKAAMARLSPPSRAEVEMKMGNIQRKYGDRLNDEQKADIRRLLAETQEGLERMRAFPLDNGDQPADAFRAYRHEDQPRDEKK
ncbi:MAG TPA: hypothetical protein VFT65_16120 [Candidatus Angelobacter sp.]|nr:hypothetical protein [Candidatus Angelobacter sp.]